MKRTPPAYIYSRYLGTLAGASIAMGASPYIIAVSPDGTKLAVMNDAGDTVRIVDALTNTLAATIATGAVPVALAFTPDGALLYVVNSTGNNVTRIVVATGSATNIAVGTSPQGIAITPDGTLAYIPNKVSNDITRLVIATGATSSIPTGNSMAGNVLFTPDGSLAFAGCFSSNLVARIVVATDAVTTIDFGNHQTGIGITSDGQTLWASTTSSFRSYTIGTSTLNAPIAHGIGASNGCFLDPTNRYIYTMNYVGNAIRRLKIADSTLATINVATGPNNVTFSPDGTLLYTSGSGTNAVSRVVVETNAVSNLSTGAGETQTAWCQFGKLKGLLYATNYGSGTLSVINCLAGAA